MNYSFHWEMKKKKKKIGVTNFVSGVKGVENKFDFEKLMTVNQHGLRRFTLKIWKINQRRQAILVTFCISESVALSIPNVANVLNLQEKTFRLLNLQEAFKTAVAQINEDGAWCILQKL